MLIYEKDNKLNIKFDPQNEGGGLEEPDFSIYKDEEDKVVISANGEISEAGGNNNEESVLPPYTVDDAGKILKVVLVGKESVVTDIQNVSGASGQVLYNGFLEEDFGPISDYARAHTGNYGDGYYNVSSGADKETRLLYLYAEHGVAAEDPKTDTVYCKDKYWFWQNGIIRHKRHPADVVDHIYENAPIDELSFTIMGTYPTAELQWVIEREIKK